MTWLGLDGTVTGREKENKSFISSVRYKVFSLVIAEHAAVSWNEIKLPLN